MLVVVGILSFLYLFFVWKTQTSAFFESRRKNTEVEKARKLAADEEESRVNMLKNLVEAEMENVHAKLDKILSQYELPEAEESKQEAAVEKLGDSLKTFGKKIKDAI